ncbi:threonine/serine exporter family protein [Caproicibacter sp.]|uniref:threonine/serine exporter family protein n=1 Tax=Caproicibacter sp. TaxID=2814884 RepID=UPI00398A3285
MEIFLGCLWAFAACVAFCFLFNIRGRALMIASFGGFLGWLSFSLLSPLHNDIIQYFIATVITAVYSESMARIAKKPATEFQIIALLPFVPGGGIFYTMEYVVIGNNSMFLSTGLHTLGIAGALAMGVLLVSTVVRLFHIARTHREW